MGVICLDIGKTSDMASHKCSSLEIGHTCLGWVDCSTDEKLLGQPHPKSSGLRLKVQMDIGDKWSPSGVCLGSVLFNVLTTNMYNGVECKSTRNRDIFIKGLQCRYRSCVIICHLLENTTKEHLSLMEKKIFLLLFPSALLIKFTSSYP